MIEKRTEENTVQPKRKRRNQEKIERPKRKQRNVYIFLVEGKSDLNALEVPISQLLETIDDNIEVFFQTMEDDDEITGGDITSKTGVHRSNIEQKIYDLFLYHVIDKNGLYAKDITRIIQIVDTDGAYIPEEKIVENKSLANGRNVFYDNNQISCLKRDNIVKRNKRKIENLDYLSTRDTIKVKTKTIPYTVYFFSCNLDHFLHRDANLNANLKCLLANVFSKTYMNNPMGFVDVISNDPGALADTSYHKSWTFIKDEDHSLHRHTNVNLLLKALIEGQDYI